MSELVNEHDKLLILDVPNDFDVQLLHEEGIDLSSGKITLQNFTFIKQPVANLQSTLVLKQVEASKEAIPVRNDVCFYGKLLRNKKTCEKADLDLDWTRSATSNKRRKVRLPPGENDS